MRVVLDVVTGGLIAAGVFFIVAGAVGLLRFPDVYARLHALTKADTLGLGFVVAGLWLRPSSWMVRLQLLVTWLLVLVATATVAHLLARASLSEGVEPVQGDQFDGGSDPS